MLPLGTHGFNDAAELMAHDDGVILQVVGKFLMLGTLVLNLPGGKAEGVCDDPGLDFIFRHFRQFKFLQTQIVDTVNTDGFCFHGGTSLLCGIGG